MGFVSLFTCAPEKVYGNCFVCGRKIDGKLRGIKGTLLADGKSICQSCAFKKMLKVSEKDTSQSLMEQMKANGLTTPSEFIPTKMVYGVIAVLGGCGPSLETYLEIDEQRQLINIPERIQNILSKDIRHEHIRQFKDLVDCQLLSDGSMIADGNSLLGAAIGGAAFGGFGAVVGAGARNKKISNVCNSLIIKVVFNDLSNPEEHITLINSPLKTDSNGYKKIYAAGQECLSILAVILKKNRDAAEASKQPASTASSSVADEIKKFKELLDMGAITEEEFNAKKKQLLGL